MKKAITWIMCMSLVLGMAGCGSVKRDAAAEKVQETADAEQTEQAAAEENVDLSREEKDYDGVEFRIAWWGAETRNEQTVEIIENFEKRYPNLKIDVEYGPIDPYFTKLTTQATAGELPDVYMMDYSKISEFVHAGQMEPLNAYIEAGIIDLSGVDDSLISGGIVDGEMYGITTGINAPTFFYDPAVLEEAGLSLSQAPTWGELSEVIKEVYEKTGYRAFINPYTSNLEIYVRSIGKTMYTDDGSGYGFSPEDLAAYLEIFYDLYESGALMSSAEYDGEVEVAASLREGTNLWLKGDGYTNLLKTGEEESGKKLFMCCHPSADDAVVSGTYLKPVMLWGISATSQNKELAAEFINYFVNDRYVYDVCGTDRGTPIDEEMREYMSTAADETGKRGFEFINFLSGGVATAISPPAPAAATEANTPIGELFEQLYYGQIERGQILDAAAAAMEQGAAVLAQGAAGE